VKHLPPEQPCRHLVARLPVRVSRSARRLSDCGQKTFPSPPVALVKSRTIGTIGAETRCHSRSPG
jgi:hypothetical protein